MGPQETQPKQNDNESFEKLTAQCSAQRHRSLFAGRTVGKDQGERASQACPRTDEALSPQLPSS